MRNKLFKGDHSVVNGKTIHRQSDINRYIVGIEPTGFIRIKMYNGDIAIRDLDLIQNEIVHHFTWLIEYHNNYSRVRDYKRCVKRIKELNSVLEYIIEWHHHAMIGNRFWMKRIRDKYYAFKNLLSVVKADNAARLDGRVFHDEDYFKMLNSKVLHIISEMKDYIIKKEESN